MTKKFYSLGMDESDRIAATFGGGFPAGALVVVEGPDGAGKSVFSQRFATGFCSEDLEVTFVTPELTTRQFIRQMDSLGYEVVDYLANGSLLYLWADVDTSSEALGELEEQEDAEYDGTGDDPSRDLLPRMSNAEAVWDADVVIIDGFGQLLANDPWFKKRVAQGRGGEAMQTVLQTLHDQRQDGTTIILTLDATGQTDDTLRPLRNDADILLDIDMRTSLSAIKRSMSVKRYSAMRELADEKISYSVQPGVGIIIETQTVV